MMGYHSTAKTSAKDREDADVGTLSDEYCVRRLMADSEDGGEEVNAETALGEAPSMTAS